MTPANFEAGMNRLRSQWTAGYSEERAKVFWASFRDVSSAVWADAITEVLAVCRAMPLLPELERAVETARLREKEVQANRARAESAAQVLENAAKKSGSTQYSKVCLDALEWKRAKGIKTESKEWEDVLVHLGKLCGMTRSQALGLDKPNYSNVIPMRFT